MAEEITGRFCFVDPVTKRKTTLQPGPGTFHIERESDIAFIVHPVVAGGLVASGASVFETQDGKDLKIEWVGPKGKNERYMIDGDYEI